MLFKKLKLTGYIKCYYLTHSDIKKYLSKVKKSDIIPYSTIIEVLKIIQCKRSIIGRYGEIGIAYLQDFSNFIKIIDAVNKGIL